MATATHNTVGAVFESREQAHVAVTELRRAGFAEDQMGVFGREPGTETFENRRVGETEAEEGTFAGAAIGAGMGALVGLGVVSGVIPVLGPAIAAGTLGTILSNAAAGATVAGLAGALIGMDIPEQDARFYETEVQAGKTLVTVHTDDRMYEAAQILESCGGQARQLSDVT